jgi:hypothetical protein
MTLISAMIIICCISLLVPITASSRIHTSTPGPIVNESDDPRRQPYLIMYGEPEDGDLKPADDLTAVSAIAPRLLNEAHLVWNPTLQQIMDIPLNSPILIAGHSSDDDFLVRANSSDEIGDYFDYKPVPPLHDGYKQGTQQMFLWGWPEPFLMVNQTKPWTPAQTPLETLYPWRLHHFVFVGSCFGVRFVDKTLFPNVRGLYTDAVFLEDDQYGVSCLCVFVLVL